MRNSPLTDPPCIQWPRFVPADNVYRTPRLTLYSRGIGDRRPDLPLRPDNRLRASILQTITKRWHKPGTEANRSL